MSEQNTNYRITFAKRGALSFISHLDFNHSFIRILKRAGLPLRYSEGFNPRPKIVFGLPLSVGMVGENELVDIGLTDALSSDEVMARLASAVPDELEIKSVDEPGLKMKHIEFANYLVRLYNCKLDTEKANAVMKNPPQVLKHTKSGDKMTDISGMIKDAFATIDGEDTVLNLTLTAFDSMYLNPEYVVSALKNANLNVPDEYDITRTEIIFKS